MSRYASSSSAVVGVLESAVTPELDWELLYDLYAARLRRIIQRKVGPAMTEDVLQETFLRAYRNRHTIDPERPLAPWLITIALRAATDAQRRQLRTVDAEEVEPTCEESGYSVVEEELVRRARALGIKHALAGLNSKERRILEAVAVDGMPYEQLAAAERMSPIAVKSAMARARTNFRSSYFGFTRRTELFGSAVGASIWRLRARLQRYQELMAEHAAAVGAAAVTVMAVGIAAYPAARPLPTFARERSVAAGHAAGTAPGPVSHGSDASSAQADPAVSVERAVPGSPRTPASGPAPTGDTGRQVEIGRHDGTAGAQFEIQATGPETSKRTWGTYTVDCDLSPTGPVECLALETVAVVAITPAP